MATCLLLTGVVDGPLNGGGGANGQPKVVELYATCDVPNLSDYGLGSANNGGELLFPKCLGYTNASDEGYSPFCSIVRLTLKILTSDAVMMKVLRNKSLLSLRGLASAQVCVRKNQV